MALAFRSKTKTWFRSRCRQLFLAGLMTCGGVAAFGQEVDRGYQAYPLQHASAEDVGLRLKSLLAETSPDVKVLADSQSNQILIQGPATAQQLAAKMLQTLDQPSAAPAAAPAADRSKEVKGYRVDGELQPIVKWLQQKYPPATGVRIAGDDRTKQIIVIAPSETQREIAGLLANGPPAAAPPVRAAAPRQLPNANNLVHVLQNITWRDLESELVRLWGNQLDVAHARNGQIVNVSVGDANGMRPVMQIDRQVGEVSFTGTERTIALWRAAVEAIDSPQFGDQATQLIAIRNADPNIVQSTVSLLNQTARPSDEQVTQAIPASSYGRKRSAVDLISMLYQQPAGAAADADQVAQPAPAQPAAGQPAQPQPRQPAKPMTPRAGQPNPQAPVPNPNAPRDPNAPAGQETDVADDTDLGLIGPVQIEIINDAIVIRGNRRDVARVRKLIEDIDRYALETQPIVEVYHLQHINNEAATTLVSELYTEILSERTGQVSIRALGEPNAILLIGREESVNVVKELIQKLDQPSPPASRFEVFRLAHVSAVDAELTIRNFFVNRPGFDTNPRTGLGTRVQVVADYRTNSLIVQASPRDLEEVRRLIESIDVEESQSAAQLKIFKLRNALAETLASVLQAAISGQPVAGQGGQQGGQGGQQGGQGQQQGGTASQAQSRLPSVTLELMLLDQADGRLLRSGILADVQVTADTNTNSLIVRAPAKSMALIGALIEQLDRLPDMSSQVKVFEIANGNATSLTTMLQQLFGQQVGGTGTNQNALGGLFGLQNQLAATTAGGDSSLVPLRFSVDQRTNSIIASGSETDLDVVGTLLLRLDEDIDDRRLTVVRLRNTQAASVAAAVQQYLQNLQSQVSQQLLTTQSISAYESVERQVFVIAEDVTNSLIVSASPRYQDEILRVIQELDVRPPMVMVQVLIAELTLDNTFEFGAEFGLQDSLVFERGRAVGTPPGSDAPSTPGFNFNGSPLPGYPNVRSYQQENVGGQSLTNFALSRASPELGYSGLVLSAASESVSLLLRALEDEGRLQILSRPQIMTMHNQAAYVQVGQDIARVTGGNFNQLGGFQPILEDRSVGLILRVLPLINDDGVIVMGVEAERSQQGSDADGLPISDGAGGVIVVPPIDLTKATTTISARDGQTVVFAGLITDTKDVRLRRVPYLADIPVLGNLFQFKSTAEIRRELIVVMTPHIVRSEEDVERIKMEETARMSWCLADVVSVGADWGLQGGHCAFCETEAPLIFPDLDPTGAGVPVPAQPPVYEQSSISDQADPGVTLQPIPADNPGGVIAPPVPEEQASLHQATPTQLSRLRPTQVIYGPPPVSNAPANAAAGGVTPAAYQPATTMRLPAPK